MARMSITFSGFADLAADIDRSGGDLHKAVDEALTKTGEYIQSQVESAATPYAAKGLKGYATGEMYGAIRKIRSSTGMAKWLKSVLGLIFQPKVAGIQFLLCMAHLGWEKIRRSTMPLRDPRPKKKLKRFRKKSCKNT